MNICFLSLGELTDFEHNTSVHIDLIKHFAKMGHNVYVAGKLERRENRDTYLSEESGVHILRIRIGNVKKTENFVSKGIGLVLLEHQFVQAIETFLSGIKFDLVIYTTPPITFVNAVRYLKRDNTKTYLLLKDIFPQNAVDLGMMKKTGLKGLLYRYFRNKEKNLYAISDRIGCMSQANVDYILKHNPEINPENVEICPNSIEVQDMRISDVEIIEMRKKYGIPTDKKVFVYGGNLGKPQDIPFIVDCLRAEKENDKVFFLIVGGGTEYGKLEAFVNEEKPANVRLMKSLPKNDYDRMVAACDVGMIFLDHRFTIPNFPSRLLSYMQAGLPVLACTDPNTDIGKVITDGCFGWWCESNDVEKFGETVSSATNCNLSAMGENGMKYLIENYTVDKAYQTIMKNF